MKHIPRNFNEMQEWKNSIIRENTVLTNVGFILLSSAENVHV